MDAEVRRLPARQIAMDAEVRRLPARRCCAGWLVARAGRRRGGPGWQRQAGALRAAQVGNSLRAVHAHCQLSGRRGDETLGLGGAPRPPSVPVPPSTPSTVHRLPSTVHPSTRPPVHRSIPSPSQHQRKPPGRNSRPQWRRVPSSTLSPPSTVPYLIRTGISASPRDETHGLSGAPSTRPPRPQFGVQRSSSASLRQSSPVSFLSRSPRRWDAFSSRASPHGQMCHTT